MKTVILATLLTMVTLQAKVTISSSSYQEQVKVTEDGQQVREWVDASKVIPGTVIRYVNSLENSGTQLATKLVVNNPIPENMEYLANTASCQSICSISYSVDGGKTFKEASDLFVGIGEERHVAQASEYTNIKWVLDSLSATSQSAVEYKARLK